MTGVDRSAEAVSQRIVDASLGAVDMIAVYVGDRLGWYRSLADDGPASAEELAARTDTNARYAREWLEQQAVTGMLTVDDATPPRFTLPAGAAEVLTDSDSLLFTAPLARMFCGSAVELPALLDAYRSGGGVSWAQLGTDARESQADMNRPWYERALAEALASVPDLDALLRRPDTSIADIGCGGGWSTIALARAYPEALLHGFDIDRASVELTQANLGMYPDLGDRVTFTERDAAHLPSAAYDAAFAFECVHDMPRPVEVLTAIRHSLVPGGTLIVMDEAVGDAFAAPDDIRELDDTERLMYGFSLLVCLPDGMSSQPSVGTGTVMRPDTLRAYASDAGFDDMTVLSIENFGFWRFYRFTAPS
ncbi:MAG: methyltransferase domain-containing protein [Rhodococcus sp.]|nr:methyltransferase domain-containing protein [Rhodococcus sp. (in: high G+C Gram-positive bacteria)]